MFQLVYSSKASGTFTASGDNEIENIVNASISNNQKLGITGVLLFQGTEFVQILEGKKDDVLALYGKICNDERHSAAKILMSREVPNRTFPFWNMAFLNADDIMSKDRNFNDIWKIITSHERSKDEKSAQATINLILKLKDDYFHQ